MSGNWKTFLLSLASLWFLFPATLPAQTDQADGAVEYRPLNPEALRESSGGGSLDFRVLVNAVNLGGIETRIAELTFHPDYQPQPHTHDAIEIFYVLSGRLGHNVNGEMGILEPGDVGIYRPGDTIIHSVESDEQAVVLTIWLPGGSAAPLHNP